MKGETMTRSTTAAVLRSAQPAPRAAGDAITDLAAAVAKREALLAEIAEDKATLEEETAATLEAIHETAARERKEDADRLRRDIAAKDSKTREIRTKFSFVLGTVTERTENHVDERELSRAIAGK